MRTTRPAGVSEAAADRWFAARGWQPNPFQREVWAAMAAGHSGLLHATTGSGKTYAVWMGALARARPGPGLQVLWLTPMRAQVAAPAEAARFGGRSRWGGTGGGERHGDTL